MELTERRNITKKVFGEKAIYSPNNPCRFRSMRFAAESDMKDRVLVKLAFVEISGSGVLGVAAVVVIIVALLVAKLL